MVLPRYAIISCAGLGSRLKKNLPKCMIEMGGKTLLERLLALLKNIPEVRIVVGFKKDIVMAEALRHRPDAVFIHNDIFDKSTNAYSVHLATRDLHEPFLIVDGDMLVRKESFCSFLDKITIGKTLLGVASAKTEGPIYADMNNQGILVEFSRTQKTDYEWSGIGCIANISFPAEGGYVFETIQPHLPLPAYDIDCYEIDTPADLLLAEQALSLHPNDF